MRAFTGRKSKPPRRPRSESQPEGRAGCRPIHQVEPATLSACDGRAQRQAQARSAAAARARAVGPRESLEDPLALFGWYAGPFVGDVEGPVRAFLADRQPDRGK